MNSLLSASSSTAFDNAVVANYRNHSAAEVAVYRLADGGLPVKQISIIGRHFETHEDIQGFYRPGDAAVAGAVQGAWFGGIFSLMLGALGFFILPAVGGLIVIGPLASIIAGAIGGAGVGALLSGLVALGIPHEQALKYQEYLKAGEFLVLVHGTGEEIALAHQILNNTSDIPVPLHDSTSAVGDVRSMARM